MPDLVAQGEQRANRWRRRLPEDQTIVLGRASGTWATAWDDRISRQHAEITWRKGRLQVRALPSARNPVFLRGRKVDRFSIQPGEHFVIGGTTFTLTDEQANVSLDLPHPVTEQTFSPAFLKQLRFRDADQRIEVLSRLSEVISGAASDSELHVRLINLIMTGIPRASAAALVMAGQSPGEPSAIRVLHWDRRTLTGEDFQPSERLIRQALEQGESVVHLWSKDASVPSDFTVSENISWAFCTPTGGTACQGWALYVAGGAGRSQPPEAGEAAAAHDVREDVKFTEIVASTLASLQDLGQLQRRQSSLSQFFSPLVLQSIAGSDPEIALAPRQADVSVLFCDLRGFSRESEKAADDLLGLLQRVSQALGVLTREILATGGVVGDFHGDSAMGFWGWPLEQTDSARRAARAALAIHSQFESAARDAGHAMSGFRVGIGIASGPAVAGKIGTVDQVKVTVFGPVVNLASRLEGMTKILRAPILLDESTAAAVRAALPTHVARVRRLAKVRPYGMDKPLEVCQLLPAADDNANIADADLLVFEEAVDALQRRDWHRAMQLLHQVPAADEVKDFLTVFIASHNRVPPDDWDGVIPLTSK